MGVKTYIHPLQRVQILLLPCLGGGGGYAPEKLQKANFDLKNRGKARKFCPELGPCFRFLVWSFKKKLKMF